MPPPKAKINKNSRSKFVVIAAGLVLIVVLTISFVKILDRVKFGGPLGDNELLVIQSPWTGWSRKQPPDVKKVFDVSGAYKIDLDKMSTASSRGEDTINNSYLYIDSYDDKEITLSVNNLSVKQGAEVDKIGINLNACGMHTFTLKKGETAKLNTCSMDVGTTWTVGY